MWLEPSMWSNGWSHGCWEPLPRTGPLPCVPLPLQTRSHTQLHVQPLCSAQRSSHTEKKFKSTQSRGGRERGGRKRPGNLVDREIGKEWQNPNRLQSCDWKKRFSWAGEKGRGHIFKDAQAGVRLLGRKDCAQVKMHFFSFLRLKWMFVCFFTCVSELCCRLCFDLKLNCAEK